MGGGEAEKSRKKKHIDQIDAKIINLLQKDGRLSNTEIGKKLRISEATVRSRIKRLVEDEYIQIVAVSNPFNLGFGIAGDLYIQAEMKKVNTVVRELKRFRELWYIIMTTGETNINAEFVVKSLEDLNDLVYNRLSKIDGVLKVDISVITKFAKRKYDFGTGLD
ncbi:MAG: Lrp/AsnC family transcriptional regulator [Desulfatiglans sp.]|jgi:Lrp/AsnC family transcriptional regulator for asnA, asnC and gidA|nr:Lrp/AsnC family transcriptional regulator [Thermodesulfobacteriota bacterium]MEE4353212.1 Lrp/AsnC family transcriptional regulator [Desulfatiglans sp.]